jgi:hypothetical protein
MPLDDGSCEDGSRSPGVFVRVELVFGSRTDHSNHDRVMIENEDSLRFGKPPARIA